MFKEDNTCAGGQVFVITWRLLYTEGQPGQSALIHTEGTAGNKSVSTTAIFSDSSILLFPHYLFSSSMSFDPLPIQFVLGNWKTFSEPLLFRN